jgi:hypothetical protein
LIISSASRNGGGRDATNTPNAGAADAAAVDEAEAGAVDDVAADAMGDWPVPVPDGNFAHRSGRQVTRARSLSE